MGFDKIIYTISHPVTGQIVYVGITQDLEKRITAHFNSPSSNLKPFMDQLKVEGLKPVISEIDRGQNRLEAFYIKKFFSEGHPLVNKNSVKDNKAWQKIAVRRINELPEKPKNVFITDELHKEWLSKYSRYDIRIISASLGLSRERVRQCMIAREMSHLMYETVKAYYDKIPAFVAPAPILMGCHYCRKNKPIEEFKRKGSIYCDPCRQDFGNEIKKLKLKQWNKRTGYAAQKKYNEKNKEKHREYMKKYHQTYKRKSA